MQSRAYSRGRDCRRLQAGSGLIHRSTNSIRCGRSAALAGVQLQELQLHSCPVLAAASRICAILASDAVIARGGDAGGDADHLDATACGVRSWRQPMWGNEF